MCFHGLWLRSFLETNAVCPVLLLHLKKMESDQFVFTTGTPTERQINIISCIGKVSLFAWIILDRFKAWDTDH